MKSSRSKKNNPNKRMAASVHEGMASGVAKFRHSYSHSKRIIAFVLALAMVLGLVYVDGKRKEARADSVTQEDATSYQATESFVDNGYITSLFGSGDLYTFINGYTPVDGVDGITILAPYRLLSFDVPAVDDATADADGNFRVAFCSENDSYTESDVLGASIADKSVGFNDDETNGLSYYLYAYTYKEVDNEGITEKVINEGSLKKVKLTTKQYKPKALSVTCDDLIYTISDDDPVTNSGSYVYVYGSHTYSCDKGSSVMADTDMGAATAPLTYTSVSGETSASSALNAEGDINDGDYIIYKKVLSRDGSRVLYMYGAKVSRDIYVEVNNKITVNDHDSTDTVVTQSVYDMSGKSLDGYLASTPSAYLHFTYNITEATSYSVTKKIDESEAESIASGDIAAGAAADVKIPVVKTDAGKTVNYEITVTATGKKPEKYSFSVIYNDGTPLISAVTVDSQTVTESEGTYTTYSKETSPVLVIKAKPGSDDSKATLSDTSCVIKEGENVISVTNNSGEYTATLTDLSEESHTYDVTITNSYGNTVTKTVTIIKDATAPTYENAAVVQNGNTINASTDKVTALKSFTITVDVKDAISGVDPTSVAIVAEASGKTPVTINPTSVSVDTYTFTVDTKDTKQYTAGTKVTYSIGAKDNAGNKIDPAAKLFDLQFCNETVKVAYTITPGLDTDDQIPASNKTTDNKMNFVVSYDIESGEKINTPVDGDVEINGSSTLPSGVSVTYDATNSTLNTEQADGTYKSTVKYNVSVDNSIELKDIVYTATNINDNPGSITIDFIRIDLDNPTADWIIDSTSVAGRTDSASHQWYRGLAIITTFGDPSGGYTSGFSSATLSGVVGGPKTLAATDSGTSIFAVSDTTDPTAGTEVSLVVTDKAGNTASKTETYFVDSKAPVTPYTTFGVDGLNAKGFIQDNNAAVSLVLDSSEDNLYRDITFSLEKYNNETSAYEAVGTGVSLIETTDKSFSKTLSEISGSAIEDGKYKVTASVADYGMQSADAVSDNREFSVDTKDPVISLATVTQNLVAQTKAMNGTESEYTIQNKLTTTKTFNVKFDVTEANIDFESCSISGPGYVTGSETVTPAADGASFSFDIAADDVALASYKGTDTGAKYTITVTDLSGRTVTKTLEIKFISDYINVSHDCTDGKIETNSGVSTVTYTITSDAPIDKASKFTVNVDAADEDKFTDEWEDVRTNQYDYEYKYKVTITVPDNESIIADTLKFNPKNVNGATPAATPSTITSIKVDRVKPQFTLHETDASGAEPSQADWYKTLKIYVAYDEGTDEYVSNLAETGISITGSGVDTSSIHNEVDTNGNVIWSTFDVAETTNATNGGDVIITATDRFGNATSAAYKFYVDSTLPNKLTLKVADKDINGMTATNDYINAGDPVITYEAYDNLIIDKATLSISKDGTAVPDILVDGIETNDNIVASVKKDTQKLSELAGTNADGVYSFTLTAKDKAGNEIAAPLSGEFTLDNTVPALGNVVMSQVNSSLVTETQDISSENKTFAGHPTATKGQKITFVVDVKDTNLDWDNTTITNSKDLTVIKPTASNYDETTGKLTFDVIPDSTYCGQTVDYTVTAKDKAGNSISHIYAVKFLSDTVKVTYEVQNYTGNTKYTEGAENLTNDNDFKIVFTIKTDAKLDLSKSTLTQTSALTPDANYSESNFKLEPDEVDNYIYTYEYAVKTDEGKSVVIDNLILGVESINGIAAQNTPVSMIKVDFNKPNLGIDDTTNATIGAKRGTTTWYKSLILVVNADDHDSDSTQPFKAGVESVTVKQNGGTEEPIGFVNEPVTVKQSPDENGTDIVFTVKDKVGNVKEFPANFHVDGINPTGDFDVKVGGASVVEDEFYAGDPDITVKISDDIKVYDYTLTIIGPEGTSTFSNTGKTISNIDNGVTKSLSTYLHEDGKNLVDGEYTVKFVGHDLADNIYGEKSIKFNVDLTDPVITSGEVIQTKKPDNKVTMNVEGQDVYYAPKRISSEDAYKVKFIVSDANVKSVKITENGTEVTYDHAPGTSTYTINRDLDKTRNGKTFTYVITLTDKAGTITEKTLIVKFLTEKITIERSITNYGDGDVDVDASGNIATKYGKFDVVYKITSDDLLDTTKGGHTADGVDGALAKAPDGLVLSPSESNADADKYVYYYTVNIDVAKPDSAAIGKLSLEVENINGVKQDSDIENVSVNAVNIDQVEPTFTIFEKDSTTDNPKEKSTGTWYKELPVDIVIDEGTDPYIANVKESGIVIAGAEITECEKDANGFVTKVKAKIDETQVVENGTKVTITVTDGVGNSTTEEHIYLVDSTDPVKATLTVDGTAINGMTEDVNYIKSDDPEIKYEVFDNLQVKESVLEYLTPGDTTAKTTTKNGEATNDDSKASISVSGKLSEITGTAEDGIYSFKLTAKDNVDNPSQNLAGKFTLDNTKPEISDINVEQPDVDMFRTVETGKRYAGASAEHSVKVTVAADDPNNNKSNTESGLASIKVTQQIGSEEPTTVIDKTYENVTDKKTETITLDGDANKAGKVVTYVVKATDRIGNEKSEVFTVSYVEDKIEVSHTFADKTETKVGQQTVEFLIRSDAPIKQEGVKVTPKFVSDNSSVTTSGQLKEKEIDKDSDKYVYTYTYTIKASDSVKLDNIECVVTNVNGAVSNTDKISYMYIDLRQPGATLSNMDQTSWRNSLRLVIKFADDSKEFKSGIKEVKVTGIKQDLAGMGYTTAAKDSSESLNGYSVEVDVKESKDLNGTPVSITVVDQVNNTKTYNYVFHVDETIPTSSLNINGKSADDADGTYLGTTSLNPTIAYATNDNIQVKNYTLNITLPNGNTIVAASGNNKNNININTTLAELIGAANCNGSVPKDGTYTVTFNVNDLAGNTPDPNPITTTFTLDNTTPKNDLQITTGRPPKFDKYNSSYNNVYTGRSYQYGQYYNTSVSIDTIVVDNNVENITVTDNGTVIYSGTALETTQVISYEGTHTVSITTVDKSGLRAETQSVTFTIDTTAPVLSTTLNSAPFSEGGATRYLNVNGDVGISYSETNKDTDDLIMTVTKTAPAGGGQSVTTSRVNEGSQVFSDEADYTVKFAATDRAGNKGAERTVTFRVDKTKPELSFTGAADHGTSTKSVNMSYIVHEAFYNDMNSCTLRIYKKVDGANEVLLKTLDIKPTSSNYSMSELFEEDGEYRFEMSAEDKCGNTNTASYTFILDGKAPIITLAGVKNYDKTSEDVTLTITVDETFFSSNKVVLKGTRIDIDGVKHDVKFSDFAANTGKISKFEQLFKEDGIYDITITSTDKAGNSSTQKIHFTKDTTDPEIKGIDDYDGTKINSFKWGTTAEEMVRDLTVCDIKVYMDGVEYDGLSDLADGSHVLRVIATDELGHTTDREVSFVLDTIAPNILISGVEEGQYLKEATQITVSVQIDEDTLTRVTLDGKEIEIVNGVATFTVNQRGQYTIFVEAIDEAGNVATKQLNFNFGDRFPWWIFLVGAGGIFLMILLLLLARRRKDKKAA